MKHDQTSGIWSSMGRGQPGASNCGLHFFHVPVSKFNALQSALELLRGTCKEGKPRAPAVHKSDDCCATTGEDMRIEQFARLRACFAACPSHYRMLQAWCGQPKQGIAPAWFRLVDSNLSTPGPTQPRLVQVPTVHC